MRVAVTGASGFVGEALIRDLLARGHDLACSYANRSPLAADARVSWHRIEELSGDSDWRSLVAGAGVAVHLAARAHKADQSQAGLRLQRQANVEASLALAHQAKAAGVARLVFVSSIGAGLERTPYQIAKREAEQKLAVLCRELSLELVVLRPPLVIGPQPPGNLATLMRWIDKGRPLPFASVQNARSFIARENLASAIAACLDHPSAAGRLFEVADTPPLSTPGLIKALARAMGKPARLFPMPPVLLGGVLMLLGRGEMAQSLLGNLTANPAEFRNTLGWRPTVSLEAAIEEMAQAKLE